MCLEDKVKNKEACGHRTEARGHFSRVTELAKDILDGVSQNVIKSDRISDKEPVSCQSLVQRQSQN